MQYQLKLSNIIQKLTIIDKKGTHKLHIQSEDNQPFRLCINTDKYFDNNAPSFKLINGSTTVIIDADDNETYEMMLMSNNNNEVNITYSIEQQSQGQSQGQSQEQSQENPNEIRKKKLSEISTFTVNLDENSRNILNNMLLEITNYYQNKQFELADTKLTFLHNLLHNEHISVVMDYFRNINNDINHDNKNQEVIQFNKKSIYNFANYIIFGFIFIAIIIFLYLKFKGGSSSQLVDIFKL